MSDTIPDGGAFDDDAAFADAAAIKAESVNTVTNDAVAGETVLPQAGDGDGGPTGGSPREAEPILDEHDASDPDEYDIVGLDDEEPGEVSSEDS